VAQVMRSGPRGPGHVTQVTRGRGQQVGVAVGSSFHLSLTDLRRRGAAASGDVPAAKMVAEKMHAPQLGYTVPTHINAQQRAVDPHMGLLPPDPPLGVVGSFRQNV